MKILILFIFTINLILARMDNHSNNQLDSLFLDIQFDNLNQKYSWTLGRANDPRKKSDISPINLFFRKCTWTIFTSPGMRFLIKSIYPKSTISNFDIEGSVALTIDDGFCGLDNPNGCMLNEVRELLKTYNANATFFTVGSHCKNVSIKEVNKLISDGNEIANHNMMDWSYKYYSENDFEYDLLLTKKILSKYNQLYSNWYRAPFGNLTDNIQTIIEKHKLMHVLPDVFAHDTYIPDPDWIASYILKRVKHGSIILIHMPERNVREWNYQVLELVLKGLKKKQMRVLNLTDITQLSKK